LTAISLKAKGALFNCLIKWACFLDHRYLQYQKSIYLY